MVQEIDRSPPGRNGERESKVEGKEEERREKRERKEKGRGGIEGKGKRGELSG